MMMMFAMLLYIFLLNFVKKVKMMVNVHLLVICLLVSIFQINMPIFCFNFVSPNMTVSPFNIVMIIVSIWITIMMVLASLKYEHLNQSPNYYLCIVMSLLIIVSIFFSTDNMLMLYISFEVSLIPTFILILKWGYQPERLQASFYFIMYTICASLPLLLALLKIKQSFYSFSLVVDMPMVLPNFSLGAFYFAIMGAFLVKVPMWGTHLWLPKAHVEAPVGGSMVLAGILLKLGGYGIMKMNYILADYCYIFQNFLTSICMWGALVVSLVCLSVTDMKSLIAYSSVIHMNLMVVGILSNSIIAVIGSIFMMVGHGLSSPGMFGMSNINYELTGSRNLLLQKGLSSCQRYWTLLWFPLIAANMAAPPSLNFASEMLICVGISKISSLLLLLMGFTIFLSAAYNVSLFAAQQGNKPMFVVPNSPLSSVTLLLIFSLSGPSFLLSIAPALLF